MTLRDIRRHQDELRRARAERRRAADRLPQPAWVALLKAYDRSCAYCSRQGIQLTRDHVLPFEHGGRATIDNIVPACRRCNWSKGAHFLWRQWIPAEPHPVLLQDHPRPLGRSA